MEYVNYLKHNFDISIIPSPHQDYNFLHKINALYFAAGRYLNTCIRQYNRIEDWAQQQKDMGSRTVHLEEEIDFNLIFSDIHYLLIALDKCYKLEGELYELLWDKQKKDIFLDLETVDDIRLMRNTLEHMEENLLKYNKNDGFPLPDEYKKNGWSWLEYQMATISNGEIQLKDKTLVFSETMFDSAIIALTEIEQKFIDRMAHFNRE